MKMLMLFSCAVQRNSALLILLLATTGLAIFAQTSATPQITSGNSVTFTVGVPGTFPITSTSSPVISTTGMLLEGVFFTANADWTAPIRCTPALGSGGSFSITLRASNAIHAALQQ